MLTIYCPPGETGIFETTNVVNGAPTAITYAPRLHTNGRYVLTVPPGFFTDVILRSNKGKAFQDENFEAIEWLGKDHVMESGDAFPGQNRPAPIAPVATEIEPKIVRMRAPPDTTGFSHGGIQYKIGKDRTVEVDERVGDELRSRGFLPA